MGRKAHGITACLAYGSMKMRHKEARIKKEMRGQTKAQVKNRSRENAATGVTNMCLRPLN